MNILKPIIFVVVALIVGFAVVIAGTYSIKKSEIVRCYDLQKQYADAQWGYSQWEEQNPEQAALDLAVCNAHNIDIHAGTSTAQ